MYGYLWDVKEIDGIRRYQVRLDGGIQVYATQDMIEDTDRDCILQSNDRRLRESENVDENSNKKKDKDQGSSGSDQS